MLSKKLKENLTQKNMLEEDICFAFVNRQISIFSRVLSPIIRLIKNQSKEEFVSLKEDTLYVFKAKGFLGAKAVDDITIQTIKLSSIKEITKKDVQLNGVRVQKFTITHNNGAVKGLIREIKEREMLRKIEAKLKSE